MSVWNSMLEIADGIQMSPTTGAAAANNNDQENNKKNNSNNASDKGGIVNVDTSSESSKEVVDVDDDENNTNEAGKRNQNTNDGVVDVDAAAREEKQQSVTNVVPNAYRMGGQLSIKTLAGAVRRGAAQTARAAAHLSGQTVEGIAAAVADGISKVAATVNNNIMKATTTTSRVVTGETTLRRLTEEARYEIFQDPYRGICAPGNAAGMEPNPWRQTCMFAALQHEAVDDGDGDDTLSVSLTCGNSCPSLRQWTLERINQAKKKKGKKNGKNNNNNNNNKDDSSNQEESFVLGQRPEDKNVRCRCDYNPFCLGSLGGVMDEVLQRELSNPQPRPTSKSCTEKEETTTSIAPSATSVVNDDDDVQMWEEPRTRQIAERQLDLDPASGTDSIYRPKTLSRIKEVRASGTVSKAKVRHHLECTLKGLTSALPLDEALQRLQERHRKSMFINPLLDEEDNNADTIRFSMPPGIENLGATCYLNTQLQCLAQNAVFMRGIFSWQSRNSSNGEDASDGVVDVDDADKATQAPKSPEDRMISILTKFQHLLARMHDGALATVNTRQFSDALGLDHFEQQDPNEFSRLLFERMHESFQTTHALAGAAAASKADNVTNVDGVPERRGQVDLANLLPHLFQGCVRYETICLHCHTVSSRDEDFMDVTLPIVKPTAEDLRQNAKTNNHVKESTKKTNPQSTGAGRGRGRGGKSKNVLKPDSSQPSILECLTRANPGDTTVQYCMDRYCNFEEVLEGDNQYFCSACDCKRDAKRQLRMKKLPPCLNVQLSRYIFDMASLSKKKLSDKVLLPTELTVYAPECNEDNSTARATPNKRRRYLLCAVMIHRGKSATSGHYVAEAMDWLTGQWFEFNDEKVKVLETGPSHSYQPDGERALPSQAETTKLIGSEDAYNMYYIEEGLLAEAVYDSLKPRMSDSVNADGGACNILGEIAINRSTIYEKLTQACLDDRTTAALMERRRQAIFNNVLANHQSLHITMSDSDEPPVWVDGDFLRRFLACNDTFEAEMRKSTKTHPLYERGFLCNHGGGVHPREARRGKLIPHATYNAIVSVLKEEYNSLDGEANGYRFDYDREPLTSTPMFCETCSAEYVTELSEKHELLENVLYLYSELDNKKPDAERELPVGTIIYSDDDRYVYLVQKKFATAFRALVSDVMKKASIADKTCAPEPESTTTEIESIAEGVDALDLSCLQFQNKPPPDVDKLDILVNSFITCKHRNCVNSLNKRIVRYVSSSVWHRIQAVFPDAIEHKLPRRYADDMEIGDDDIGCRLCEAEGTAVSNLSARISALAGRGPRAFKSLTSDEIVAIGPETKYCLVPTSELKAFARFKSTFKSANTRKESMNITEQVKSILCPAQRSPFLGESSVGLIDKEGNIQSKRINQLRDFLRPVVCKKHSLPIQSAVLQSSTDQGGHRELSEKVSILEEEKHKEFLVGLGAVALSLVQSEESNSSLAITDEDVELAEAAKLCDDFGVDKYYPKFSRSFPGPVSKRSFSLSSETVGIWCDFSSEICDHDECNAQYLMWEKHATPDPPSNTKKGCGSAADDPINVDSDMEDKTKLRVFEAEESASEHDILSALATCTNMPLQENDGNNEVRRSSRRKTSRMPVGVLKSEQTVDVDIVYNMAAIRLHLLQQCTNGSAFELNHRLRIVASPVAASGDSSQEKALIPSSPKFLDCGFDKNEVALFEIFPSGMGSTDGNGKFDPNQMALIRQAAVEETSKTFSSDVLLDHLIGLSNVASSEKAGTHGDRKKRKAPSQERGFTGTFLSSSRSVPSSDSNKSEKSDKDTEDAKESENVGALVVVDGDENAADNDDSSSRKKAKREALDPFASSDEDADDQENECKPKARATQSPFAKSSLQPMKSQPRPTVAVTPTNGSRPVSTAPVEIVEDDARDDPKSMDVDVDLYSHPSDDDLVMRIAQRLVASRMADESKQFACWEAAQYAVEQMPDSKDLDMLVDAALAKYLEKDEKTGDGNSFII